MLSFGDCTLGKIFETVLISRDQLLIPAYLMLIPIICRSGRDFIINENSRSIANWTYVLTILRSIE